MQKFENSYPGVRIFCIKRKFDATYDRASVSFYIFWGMASNCIFTVWVPFSRKICGASRGGGSPVETSKCKAFLKHWPSRQARRIISTRTDGNGVLAVRYLVLPKIQSQQILVKDTHVPTSNLSCFFISLYHTNVTKCWILSAFSSSVAKYFTLLRFKTTCHVFWNEFIVPLACFFDFSHNIYEGMKNRPCQ